MSRFRALAVSTLAVASLSPSVPASAVTSRIGLPRPAALMAGGSTHCVGAADPSCGTDVHTTIPEAMQHAASGDTILVGPGTYPGFFIGAGITIRSLSGPSGTVIVPPKPSPDGVVVSYGAAAVLEGFTIDSTGSSGGTVALIGEGSIIRNNRIVNSSAARAGIGVLVNAFNTAGGIEIVGNTISNFSSGIYFNRGASNNLFASNTLTGNGAGVVMGAGDGGFTGNRFLANRFENGLWSVRMDQPLATDPPNGSNSYRHNCFVNNANGFAVGTGNPLQDAAGNYWGASDGATGHGGSGDTAGALVDASVPNETCVPILTESPVDPVFPADPGSTASGPAVLRENGSYRMWYSKGTSIGYATSPDATTWVRSPDLAIPGAPARFQQPSVTRIGPTTLRLWWGTGNSSGTGSAPTDWKIFTSVSADDGATWGPAAEVSFPAGIEPDRYQMHVLSVAGGFQGFLQSGGTIYRVDTMDPSASSWTTAQLVTGLPECPTVASTRCTSTMVTRDGAGYRMWYSTYQDGDTNDQDSISYAISDDGLRFHAAANPLLHADDGIAWRASRTTQPWVVQRDRTFDLFFAGTSVSGSGIGVATTGYLPLTILDCDASSNDAFTIQSVVDAIQDGGTIALKGVCDLSQAPASGAAADGTGISAAAIVIPPSVADLTIASIDPDAPARLVGSGTQAGIYVAPGAHGAVIRDLEFSGLAQPIVVHNASDTAIGSASGSLAGNRIIGSGTTTAGILGLGQVNAANVVVSDGDGTARTFPTPPGQTLSGLKVYGNYVSLAPPGQDAIAISVYQADQGRITGTRILGNAVGLNSPEYPSMNMGGIRVWARSGNSAPAMIDGVEIEGNNLGRLEELGLVANDVADLQAAGRFGILVNRAANVNISGNGIRVRLSTTPGLSMPGGAIILGNVDGGRVHENGIIELTDQTVGMADLGAISVIDGLSKLYGGSGAGPATRNIEVSDNIVGFVNSDDGLVGASRGLTINGASNVTAFGNRFKKIDDKSILISAELHGFGPSGSEPILAPARVDDSRLCGNWLNTSSSAPGDRDTPRSQVSFRTGLGSGGNAFPGGHLFTGNSNC